MGMVWLVELWIILLGFFLTEYLCLWNVERWYSTERNAEYGGFWFLVSNVYCESVSEGVTAAVIRGKLI